MIEVRSHDNGCCFLVHVTPGARKPMVGGEHDGALRVSVREVAEKGKANRAVIETVANAIGVRRADCEVIAGHTSRRKTVYILGLAASDLTVLLLQLTEQGSPDKR